ncbi:MAG: enoyl-CoA hydratase/isomerase family protein [Acidimicrobiia bacterium]
MSTTEAPVAVDEPVIVEVKDHKLFITLNRPKSLNAHNEPMRYAIEAAIDRLDNDDTLVAAILKGNGRAFSAGADLKEERPFLPGRTGNEHFYRVEQAKKPVIACLHGYAVGGGLELGLCCDIRVACADALLGTPEARTFGGMPGIAVHRLPQMIARGEAMKIMLSSQPITAQRAYEIGLVQEVAPDYESMVAAAERLADQMAECSLPALKRIKQLTSWTFANEVIESHRFGRLAGAEEPGNADRSKFLKRDR